MIDVLTRHHLSPLLPAGPLAALPDPPLTAAWFTPAWRNTFILIALGFAVYPFMPEPNNEPQNPAADPEGWKRYLEDPKTPWITKYMGSFYTDPTEKRELVREHVNMRIKAAEDKLLYQDAEKPQVQRIRNRGWVYVYALSHCRFEVVLLGARRVFRRVRDVVEGGEERRRMGGGSRGMAMLGYG